MQSSWQTSHWSLILMLPSLVDLTLFLILLVTLAGVTADLVVVVFLADLRRDVTGVIVIGVGLDSGVALGVGKRDSVDEK